MNELGEMVDIDMFYMYREFNSQHIDIVLTCMSCMFGLFFNDSYRDPMSEFRSPSGSPNPRSRTVEKKLHIHVQVRQKKQIKNFCLIPTY